LPVVIECLEYVLANPRTNAVNISAQRMTSDITLIASCTNVPQEP